MVDTSRLSELAEAVADGRPFDWTLAEAIAASDDDRAAVAAYRGLAEMGEIFATAARTAGRSSESRLVLPPGTSWGALRILEHVGRGRFGDVYRAWDPALDRHVALKLIASDERLDTGDSQVVEEGRMMARVRHPNVVTIHGAQRIDHITGLWMEFVDGRTLEAELADRGPFTADELAVVGRQVCDALTAVHDAGLVHRDVKASNVLRDTMGRVLLGDFGTGRELEVEAGERTGLVGTPAYLAPEIFAGEAATPQSDIYSLGVLLFHLATGEYPHDTRSLRALRDAHSQSQPQSLREIRPDLPLRLVEVIETALEADPARRYHTVTQIARGLAAGAGRTVRRRTAMLILGVTVAVAALGVLAWRQFRAPFDFKARDWVLVTAFENRTGEPVFNGALETALELELRACRN